MKGTVISHIARGGVPHFARQQERAVMLKAEASNGASGCLVLIHGNTGRLSTLSHSGFCCAAAYQLQRVQGIEFFPIRCGASHIAPSSCFLILHVLTCSYAIKKKDEIERVAKANR